MTRRQARRITVRPRTTARRPLAALLAGGAAVAAAVAGLGAAPASADAGAARVARPADQAGASTRGRVLSAEEIARLRVPVTPREDKRIGRVYRGLAPRNTGLCTGLFQVDGLNQCTHGPDDTPAGVTVDHVKPPLPSARQLMGLHRVSPAGAASKASASALAATNAVSAAAAPTAVVCEGDGVTGKRTQVLYVWSSTDRLATYLETFRGLAAGVDTIYDASAQETGGRRRVRFQTTASNGTCVATVTGVQLTSAAMTNFSTMVKELQAKGYSRTDRKYLIFADARTYCGIGSFSGDTRKGDTNRSNVGPAYARADSSCWDAVTASHELGHNLGAVNNNAPNTSRGGHCVDEWDVMCYSDEPYYPAMVTRCADRAHDARLDCNHDDYYNTAPHAGSYLATYYNVADNPFLIMGAGGGSSPSPTPTTSTASPTATKTASPTPTTMTPTPTTTPTAPTRTASPTPTTPVTPTRTASPTPTTPTTPTRTGSPTATPTVSPTPTVTPTVSPTPTGCALPETYTGTLSGPGRYAFQPNGTTFTITSARTLQACLTGPAGADFNLYLYAWTGRSWALKASGTTSSASESVSVAAAAGTYVWQVLDVRGSGSYTLQLAR